jgi:hypothetical protein
VRTPDTTAHHYLAGLAQQARHVHDFAKAGHQTEALEHAGAVERLLTAWRLDAGHADREAIHRHFSLSYANYLVLPRTLLQSMPDEWQARFVALLDEMDDAFQHVPQAEGYKVEAATQREVSDLDEGQLEVEGDELVMLPVVDPVPHYDRGRTRIEPQVHRCDNCEGYDVNSCLSYAGRSA